MTFLALCYISSNDIEALEQPSTSIVKSEPAEEPGPSRKRPTVDSDDEDDDTNIYLQSQV